jgi:hypothetical protein
LILTLPCHAGKIHDAVAKRDLVALELVLKNEPRQINRRCYPDSRTPLHMAVALGDTAMVNSCSMPVPIPSYPVRIPYPRIS